MMRPQPAAHVALLIGGSEGSKEPFGAEVLHIGTAGRQLEQELLTLRRAATDDGNNGGGGKEKARPRGWSSSGGGRCPLVLAGGKAGRQSAKGRKGSCRYRRPERKLLMIPLGSIRVAF